MKLSGLKWKENANQRRHPRVGRGWPAFISAKGFSPASIIPVIGPILIKYNDATTETLFVASTVGQAAGRAQILVGALWKPEQLRVVPITISPLWTPAGATALTIVVSAWHFAPRSGHL